MNILARGSKIVTVLTALIPLYWTIMQVDTVLTAEGQKLARHPLIILAISYGTAYAATGDGPATAQSLLLVMLVTYYIMTLHPEIVEKYFKNVSKNKDAKP